MRRNVRTARRTWALLAIISFIFSFSNVALAGSRYKIRNGDTVWDVAKKQHVSVNSILKANGLTEKSTLRIGGSLVIPGKTQKKTYAKAKPAAQACKAVNAVRSIRTEGVYLRSGPSTKQRSVAKLHAGTSVHVVGMYGEWRKVVLSGGAKGFVHASLLSQGSASSERIAEALAARPTSSSSSLVHTALACRGARYSRGGTSRGGFDCSGFTRYVYAKYGISLPHSSAAQSRLGSSVSRGSLQPGDLVFFQTYRRGVSHVGIYIGNDQFVHASTHRGGVRVDCLSHSYYAPRYRGARRVG